jgi:hypothetical protein
MTTVTLSNQIINFDKLKSKDVNKLTFKDAISLVYHMVHSIGEKSDLEDHEKWKTYYNQFLSDLAAQNRRTWPKIIINRNDYSARMDCNVVDEFISSDNILTLLLRILYLENYKRPHIFKAYNYHPITGHVIAITKSLDQLTVFDVFDLVFKHMEYYINIYNQSTCIEYKLAKSIISQIK